MANLLGLTNQIKGAAFANIYEYLNSKGEIADYVVNLGMNYGKAKEDDFLIVCKANALELVEKTGFPLSMVATALVELKKSLNPLEPQTTQGEAQSNAYTVVNGCVKIHNEFMEVYIFAYKVSKKVLVAGEYGIDTRRPATKCKDAVKKALKLKTANYTQFKITREKFESMKVLGETLSF